MSTEWDDADVQRMLPAQAALPRKGSCSLPPAGWFCTRDAGHEGPCPTWYEATGDPATPLPPELNLEAIDRIRRRSDDAAKFIADLDRCPHGRHSIDSCFSCPGGQSAGNPHLVEGQIIGYDYTGRPYRVPAGARGDRGVWLGVELP